VDDPLGCEAESEVIMACLARDLAVLLHVHVSGRLEGLPARGPVDCSVNVPAIGQLRVGRVDYGVDILASDVAIHQEECAGTQGPGEHAAAFGSKRPLAQSFTILKYKTGERERQVTLDRLFAQGAYVLGIGLAYVFAVHEPDDGLGIVVVHHRTVKSRAH
jgi:hypothetical protein